MTAVGEMGVSEVGVEAAAALREILARAVGGSPVASYTTEQPLPWTTLQGGGWDLLGAPEEAGGAGATLRDLVEIARVWGWSVVPSPLIPTLMAKRWSAAAREYQGPVTVAVPTRTSGNLGVAPFGLEPGVRLLMGTIDSDRLVDIADAGDDGYAPSLRLTETSMVTELSPEAAAEMGVVWAAEAAGCAARMLTDAVAYAKERQQFGQPIGRFQAVKHQLADAHLLAEQAETAAIWASLEPTGSRTAVLYCFDSSLRVIETAVQVHGGLGFTWEMGLHMYLRHVSALRELAAGLPR